jgi:hypothetical protein
VDHGATGSIADSKGRRAQKQVGGFSTKREAQAAINQALSGVQRGAYIAPSRQTLGEFLTIWIDGVRTEIQITAFISYKQMVEQYRSAPRLRSASSDLPRCTSSRGTRSRSRVAAKPVAAVLAV